MEESRQVKKSLPVSEIYNRFLCNWVILRFVHIILFFFFRSISEPPFHLHLSPFKRIKKSFSNTSFEPLNRKYILILFLLYDISWKLKVS